MCVKIYLYTLYKIALSIFEFKISDYVMEEEPEIQVVPHYIEENGLEPPAKKIKLGLN